MMKGGMVVDDSMSNLTSASNDASNSSGNRIEFGGMYPQQPSASSPTAQTQSAPKKKRNLPGNPDPEAEVIALSPRTLMATNRFVCEICNKGFQRDQNLQLHRRGHNLPWKLKQRNNKEVVRKKVYVCPETTCVHHDPSRALGDLTGIKKHFFRKHGEKKWKCEKCSKRYAVQSDWKAHSKICGTREYRCDCGTLFSRRDSYITHRAFCDALAEESARSMTSNPLIRPSQSHHHQQGTSSTIQLNLPNPLLNAAGGHGCLLPSSIFPLKREQDLPHGFGFRPSEMPPWLASLPPVVETGHQDQLAQAMSHQENLSPNPISTNTGLSSLQAAAAAASPHMSATALLQKAAQIGVTMSNKPPCQEPSDSSILRSVLVPHQAHMNTVNMGLFSSSSLPTSTAGSTLGLNSSREDMEDRGFFQHQLGLASFGNKTTVVTSGCMEPQPDQQVSLGPTPPPHHHHGSLMGMMSSLSSGNHLGFEGISSSSPFGENFDGTLNSKRGSFKEVNFQTDLHGSKSQREGGGGGCSAGGHGNDGLTRDFLSLKVFPQSQREFINMEDLHHQMGSSSYEHQNPPPWQS